jgi:hypothetical protein
MEMEQMMASLLAEIKTNQAMTHQSKGNESRARTPERRNAGQDGKQPRNGDGQDGSLAKENGGQLRKAGGHSGAAGCP